MKSVGMCQVAMSKDYFCFTYAYLRQTRPESVQPSYVNTAAAPADFIAREDLGMAGAGTAGVGANHAQNGWSVGSPASFIFVDCFGLL